MRGVVVVGVCVWGGEGEYLSLMRPDLRLYMTDIFSLHKYDFLYMTDIFSLHKYDFLSLYIYAFSPSSFYSRTVGEAMLLFFLVEHLLLHSKTTHNQATIPKLIH